MRQFRVRFNKGKQSVMFHIDQPIKAFRREHKCYAQYWDETGRKQRRGLFGHIHLPSMHGMKRCEYNELVTHEIAHLIDDWWRCRKGNRMTDNNEELRATLAGEISRKFWSIIQKTR